MSATVRISIEDIDAALASYESIKVYSDTSPDGAFTTLVTTITLVADTHEYSYSDSNGSAATWYRFTLYHSTGPLESDQSAPFQGGFSLSDLRIEGAMRAHAGAKGTATGGNGSSLVDASLMDSGVDTSFLSGWWVYRPNAENASDRMRRLKEVPFTVASGTIEPIRSWTAAPAEGEVYHLFAWFPPVDQPPNPLSWNRIVRQALRRCRYRDLLVLGVGDGATTRFELNTHAPTVSDRQVRRVFLRTEDSAGRLTEVDASKQGRWWELITNTPDSLIVNVKPAPSSTQTVVVEAYCMDAELYRDDDTTLVEPERAIRAVAYEALVQLNMREPGRYAAELMAAEALFYETDSETAPQALVRHV